MWLKAKFQNTSIGALRSMIRFLGHCIINLFKSFKFVFSGKMKLKETVKQAAFIGFDSLWISLVIVFVAGSVISLQLSKQFAMSGAEGYIGSVVSFVLLRELAPGFTAMAISARSGTAMSAEIANMQITEQVDAMKTLGVDPIGYLFVPRMIASMVVVPLVTIVSEFIGILGGMIIAQSTINLHPNRFLNSIWLQTDVYDIWVSIIKASVFGLIVSLVCCTRGYLARGGAKDVGEATIKAAMYSTIILLIVDFLLSWVFFA